MSYPHRITVFRLTCICSAIRELPKVAEVGLEAELRAVLSSEDGYTDAVSRSPTGTMRVLMSCRPR